jgi:hypothetical protein
MEQEERRIVNQDQLLEEAECLAGRIGNKLERNLRDRSPGQSVHLDKELRSLSGELKRVSEFYQRRLRKGDPKIEQQVLKLLAAEVPQRSKIPTYWRILREVLTEWLPNFRSGHSDEEALFVLGWTFRLLRSPRI